MTWLNANTIRIWLALFIERVLVTNVTGLVLRTTWTYLCDAPWFTNTKKGPGLLMANLLMVNCGCWAWFPDLLWRIYSPWSKSLVSSYIQNIHNTRIARALDSTLYLVSPPPNDVLLVRILATETQKTVRILLRLLFYVEDTNNYFRGTVVGW